MTMENRSVRDRIHSLSEAVTELCSYCGPLEDEDEDDEPEDEEDCPSDPELSAYNDHMPIGRVSSHPPLLNCWVDSNTELEYYDTCEDNSNDWIDKLQQEVELVGMERARVPCVILVDEDSDHSDDEQETSNERDTAESKDELAQNEPNYDEIFQTLYK